MFNDNSVLFFKMHFSVLWKPLINIRFVNKTQNKMYWMNYDDHQFKGQWEIFNPLSMWTLFYVSNVHNKTFLKNVYGFVILQN